jgi:hypothetical protein
MFRPVGLKREKPESTDSSWSVVYILTGEY